MSQKNYAELISQIESTIYTNTSRAVTGDIIQEALVNVVDSVPVVSGTPNTGDVLVFNSGTNVWTPISSGTFGGGGGGALLAANNFSDIANSGTALTNLGITAFAKTLLGVPASGNALDVLGVTSFAKTLLGVTASGNALDIIGATSYSKSLLALTNSTSNRTFLGLGTTNFPTFSGVLVSGVNVYDTVMFNSDPVASFYRSAAGTIQTSGTFKSQNTTSSGKAGFFSRGTGTGTSSVSLADKDTNFALLAVGATANSFNVYLADDGHAAGIYGSSSTFTFRIADENNLIGESITDGTNTIRLCDGSISGSYALNVVNGISVFGGKVGIGANPGGTEHFQIYAAGFGDMSLDGTSGGALRFKTSGSSKFGIFTGFTAANVLDFYDYTSSNVSMSLNPSGLKIQSPTNVQNMLQISATGNYPLLQAGPLNGVPTYGGIWLGNITPSATNFSIVGNGSELVLNAPTGNSIWMRINNSNVASLSSTGLNVTTGSIAGLTETLTPGSDGPTTLTIKTSGGAKALQLGTFPAASGYGGLWAGDIIATTSNHAFISNGINETIFNVASGGTLHFRTNNASMMTATASRVTVVDGTDFLSRITKRESHTTSTATPSINSDNIDFYELTAQAANITSVTVTGTPTRGQTLWISITGTGTHDIAWGSNFESSATITLPTTGAITTTRADYGFIWNTATSKWRIIAAG